MDWGQVITIIFGIAGFMSIFMFLINKRIDDLRHDMDRRFSELKEDMDKRFEKLEQDIREIRHLLYKVLGTEVKGD